MKHENSPKSEAEMPSRRRLLKQAAVALPVVATIPSGAALARSSNLIGYKTGDAGETLASGGQIRCLDNASVYQWPSDSVADLGVPPLPNVTVVTQRTYKRPTGSETFTASRACSEGGDFKYNGTDVNIPKGVVVSATALSSFAIVNIVKTI